jgi:DNA-binding MarR family transcriptional regulator
MSNSLAAKHSRRTPRARRVRADDRPRGYVRGVRELASGADGAVRLGFLAELLGYQLRLAHAAVFRDFERSVGQLGISPGRAGLLAIVEANPGLAQSRLAEAAGLDRSTLVPLLDEFAAAGWLERRAGPDRRTNGLWLTVAGRRIIVRIKRRVRAHEARIAARLTPAQRADLIRLLARLRKP